MMVEFAVVMKIYGRSGRRWLLTEQCKIRPEWTVALELIVFEKGLGMAREVSSTSKKGSLVVGETVGISQPNIERGSISPSRTSIFPRGSGFCLNRCQGTWVRFYLCTIRILMFKWRCRVDSMFDFSDPPS